MPCAALLAPLLMMATCGPGLQADGTLLLADFPASIRDLAWDVVDDDVMGGRSRGDVRLEKGSLLFTGTTNTDGGGFSSIRSRPRRFDLEGFEGIRVRVRGDARTYTFRLTTRDSQSGSYRPSFWADFETRAEDWEVIDIPFDRFRPRWRGRWLDGPELNTSAIDGLGLMIYDDMDGPFRLEVDWIRAYREPLPFSMDALRWQKRPVVLFAPDAQDGRLRRQLAEIEATRDLFDERDMVLIVVLSNGSSHAGSRTLSAIDAERLRTIYGVTQGAFALRLVGKDGGLKRDSDDVVAVESLYAQIDGMPMRQQEVRRR